MNGIMTTSAKSNAVINVYSQLWGFLPRLNMMDYSLSWCHIFRTLLTFIVISLQTLVTPFSIKAVMKSTTKRFTLKSYIILFELGNTLSFISAFVRTYSRAVLSFSIVIRKCPKRLEAFLAVLVPSSFSHNIYCIGQPV